MVVVVKKIKRSRIGLDHRENIRRAKRLGNAVHHVNDLPKLLEPPAILGMALHDVLAQHTRGPTPKLHATTRLDAVPNRDDDVKVVMLDLVNLAIGGSCRKFCDN